MRMEWSQGVIICDYSSCRGVVFFKIRLILRGSFLSFYGVIICDYLSCRGVFFIFLCGHYLWLFIMQRGGFLKYFMGSFFVIICHAQGCFYLFIGSFFVIICHTEGWVFIIIHHVEGWFFKSFYKAIRCDYLLQRKKIRSWFLLMFWKLITKERCKT